VVAEIYGGLAAAKAAFDIAKGLKDIHDATVRNAAVIELQEKILSEKESRSAATPALIITGVIQTASHSFPTTIHKTLANQLIDASK
jgi:hypothetical protein